MHVEVDIALCVVVISPTSLLLFHIQNSLNVVLYIGLLFSVIP